jgi:site-specific DNA-methyltransferase (adenine-specific)
MTEVRTDLGMLFRADAFQWLRLEGTDSAAAIFADPPFNVGKDYGAGVSDSFSPADYLCWCRNWLAQCIRVLMPGGSLFLHNLPRHNVPLGAWLLEQGLDWCSWIAVKECRIPGVKGRLYPDHMSVLWLSKGRRRVFNRPRIPVELCRHCKGEVRDYGGKRKLIHPDGVLLGEVWTDCKGVFHASGKDPSRVGGQAVLPDGSRSRMPSRRGNQLPLVIPERCILMATDPGDLVIDPFMGSGTTAHACELHGRRWRGCDLGDCSAAVRRIWALPH